LVGWLASLRFIAAAGCSRTPASRPPLRRTAVRASARGSGETSRARRQRVVSGACCNLRYVVGSSWAVCSLTWSFRRSSALLRLMYDMLTLSEHAALRTALVHKRCGGSTAACL
jgi:hypothetical protein